MKFFGNWDTRTHRPLGHRRSTFLWQNDWFFSFLRSGNRFFPVSKKIIVCLFLAKIDTKNWQGTRAPDAANNFEKSIADDITLITFVHTVRRTRNYKIHCRVYNDSFVRFHSLWWLLQMPLRWMLAMDGWIASRYCVHIHTYSVARSLHVQIK